MQTDELISVREYLSTSYDPDCDYVDGVVEERNVGETDHSSSQIAVGSYYFGVWPLTEQRVQVSPTRFRVPDVCVVVGPKPADPIIRTPPLIVIEILSLDDRMSRVKAKLNDFLEFGVAYIWLLDPKTCQAYQWTSAGMTKGFELRTENPDTLVPLEAVFE